MLCYESICLIFMIMQTCQFQKHADAIIMPKIHLKICSLDVLIVGYLCSFEINMPQMVICLHRYASVKIESGRKYLVCMID